MTHLFLVSAIDSISGVDTLWVLLGAMLVFWMQPGFALVEAGMTRSKNTANILMKNFCDFMCGSVLFWIIGFSLMFGTDHGFVRTCRCRHSLFSRRCFALRRPRL